MYGFQSVRGRSLCLKLIETLTKTVIPFVHQGFVVCQNNGQNNLQHLHKQIRVLLWSAYVHQ